MAGDHIEQFRLERIKYIEDAQIKYKTLEPSELVIKHPSTEYHLQFDHANLWISNVPTHPRYDGTIGVAALNIVDAFKVEKDEPQGQFSYFESKFRRMFDTNPKYVDAFKENPMFLLYSLSQSGEEIITMPSMMITEHAGEDRWFNRGKSLVLYPGIGSPLRSLLPIHGVGMNRHKGIVNDTNHVTYGLLDIVEKANQVYDNVAECLSMYPARKKGVELEHPYLFDKPLPSELN